MRWMKVLAVSFRCCMPLKGQTTVFARLSAAPNEGRLRCYKARGKVCDLVWVTSGWKFNMRRRSLALAGPPKSAKNRGVLIQDSAINRANTVYSESYFRCSLQTVNPAKGHTIGNASKGNWYKQLPNTVNSLIAGVFNSVLWCYYNTLFPWPSR